MHWGTEGAPVKVPQWVMSGRWSSNPALPLSTPKQTLASTTSSPSPQSRWRCQQRSTGGFLASWIEPRQCCESNKGSIGCNGNPPLENGLALQIRLCCDVGNRHLADIAADPRHVRFQQEPAQAGLCSICRDFSTPCLSPVLKGQHPKHFRWKHRISLNARGTVAGRESRQRGRVR